jgi:hypothetical protein
MLIRDYNHRNPRTKDGFEECVIMIIALCTLFPLIGCQKQPQPRIPWKSFSHENFRFGMSFEEICHLAWDDDRLWTMQKQHENDNVYIFTDQDDPWLGYKLFFDSNHKLIKWNQGHWAYSPRETLKHNNLWLVDLEVFGTGSIFIVPNDPIFLKYVADPNGIIIKPELFDCRDQLIKP